MRVFPLFDSMVTDGRTARPTDRRTDKASYRVACPQLKKKQKNKKKKKTMQPQASSDFFLGTLNKKSTLVDTEEEEEARFDLLADLCVCV